MHGTDRFGSAESAELDFEGKFRVNGYSNTLTNGRFPASVLEPIYYFINRSELCVAVLSRLVNNCSCVLV